MPLVSPSPDNLLDLTQQYNLTLSSLLDKHAPKKTKTITERTDVDWYTDELGKQKSALRKLERNSNQSKLAIDADIYIRQHLMHTTSYCTRPKSTITTA